MPPTALIHSIRSGHINLQFVPTISPVCHKHYVRISLRCHAEWEMLTAPGTSVDHEAVRDTTHDHINAQHVHCFQLQNTVDRLLAVFCNETGTIRYRDPRPILKVTERQGQTSDSCQWRHRHNGQLFHSQIFRCARKILRLATTSFVMSAPIVRVFAKFVSVFNTIICCHN